jgi:hypothetical protein
VAAAQRWACAPDTTWVVYGRQKRFQGEVIGIPSAELFRQPQPA